MRCPRGDSLPGFFSCPRFLIIVTLEGVFSGDGTLSSPAKRNKKIEQRLGRGASKISGSTFQKRRGHLDFSAVNCKITAWHHNYLVLAYIQFRALKLDLILVLRSQFFEYLRETLYKQALEHLEAARQEKKRGKKNLPTETPDYY